MATMEADGAAMDTSPDTAVETKTEDASKLALAGVCRNSNRKKERQTDRKKE